MSDKVYKDHIEFGYHGYDKQTKTEVEIMDQIITENYLTFFICRRLDTDELIICELYNLKNIYNYE